MQKETQNWSFIIFVYNEEAAIKELINDCLRVLDIISPIKSELIIINDGSTDNTPNIIQDCINGIQNAKLITHKTNQGIGNSIKNGYREAQYENICAIPGDGQFSPDELLPHACIPSKTILSFYRTTKPQYTRYRKFLSACNRLLNHYLLRIKIKDVNWIKVYKKDFFTEVNPVLSSLLLESEICAAMLKNAYKIIEVPSTYHPRIGGKAKGGSYNTVSLVIREMFKFYFTLNLSKKSM